METGWESWAGSSWKRELIATLQYLKGAYKKEVEQIFTRADGGRMRESGFKLKEERFLIRYEEEIFYCVGGEALEQVVQRRCGCLSMEVFKTRLDEALSNLL